MTTILKLNVRLLVQHQEDFDAQKFVEEIRCDFFDPAIQEVEIIEILSQEHRDHEPKYFGGRCEDAPCCGCCGNDAYEHGYDEF